MGQQLRIEIATFDKEVVRYQMFKLLIC